MWHICCNFLCNIFCCLCTSFFFFIFICVEPMMTPRKKEEEMDKAKAERICGKVVQSFRSNSNRWKTKCNVTARNSLNFSIFSPQKILTFSILSNVKITDGHISLINFVFGIVCSSAVLLSFPRNILSSFPSILFFSVVCRFDSFVWLFVCSLSCLYIFSVLFFVAYMCTLQNSTLRPSPPTHPTSQQSPHPQPPSSHNQLMTGQVQVSFWLVFGCR